MNLKITLSKKWLAHKLLNEKKAGDNVTATVEGTQPSPQISLFGYYDTLTFDEPDWHGFRPGNNRYLKNDDAQEEYAIRLVNPDSEIKTNGISKILEENPIAACTLVHFSDDFLKKYADADWKVCFNVFRDSVAYVLKGENDLRHFVYFSLGYNDAAILLFAKGVSVIKDSVEKLRKLTFPIGEEGKDHYRIISSAYTLIGYGSQIDNISENDKVSAMMDFTFYKQYVYKGKVISLAEIEEELKKTKSGEANSKIASNMLFGSFDWRVSANEVYLKKLIKFHSEFIKEQQNALNRFETRLLLDNKDIDDVSELVSKYNMETLDVEVFAAYEQFKKCYQELEETHHAHNRVLGAIDRLILQYFKIISTGHCYDVKSTVGKFIESYLTSATALMLYMGESGVDVHERRQVFDRHHLKYDNITYVRLIEKSADEFRRAVNSLLFDLWRSDSLYFEGQTSAHPTVGSASKILFAYNKILVDWDKAWETAVKAENRQDGKETGFSYLVTSGGCDITENVDLFDYNHDALNKYGILNNEVVKRADYSFDTPIEKISRPIIVTIPEASLYDVKGLLIRLAHEFFHKRGERLRGLRAEKYYTSICAIFASNVEHYTVSYFLRKKAQYIFKNRIYPGELRNVYEYKNEEAISEWLSDLDNYYNCYRSNSEELNPEKLTENSEHFNDLCKLFESEVFYFSKGLNKFNKEYPDKYKDLISRLNSELFRAADELGKWYGEYSLKKKNDAVIAEACTVLKEDIYKAISKNVNELIDKIGEGDSWDNLYSFKVYNRSISQFIAALNSDELKKEVAPVIQSFADKIYAIMVSEMDEPYAGRGPFADISILARKDSNHIGKTVWKDFVNWIENVEMEPLLNFTELTEWVKDVSPIYQLCAAISFKETYADYMAIAALLDIDRDDKAIEGYLQYIFVTIFEVRNIHELFHTGEYPVNKDESMDFARFLRFGTIAKIRWQGLADKFKEKEKEIKKLITKYYSSILNCSLDKETEFANYLYNILMEMFANLHKYDGGTYEGQYTSNLKAYLNECEKDLANVYLIGEMRSGAKEIADAKPCDDGPYVNFIMRKWLEIYREQK